jgi:enolase
MSNQIRSVRAIEILDSRGTPTLRVFVHLDNGVAGTASVPSGASTGEHEAVELRDGEKQRYGGKGVRRAVANVNEIIGPRLAGLDPTRQSEIDRMMLELDGTPNKAHLGANAILGVSQAIASAAALACGLPLYAYLGGAGARHLPVPMMNVINGGKHADSSLDFQEFMIVPKGAPTFAEALRYGAETFQALKALLHERGQSTAVGDEGGFAPQLRSNEEACELIVAAITRAGYRAGKDISIALDPAASSFFEDGTYRLTRSHGGDKSSADMTALYRVWIDQYPIVSLEDGLAENDWNGFRELTAQLGERIQIVGDDILVTNPENPTFALRPKGW